MKDNFYQQLLKELPVGYAYHRIICDKDGIPCDYEFIEVNAAFEKATGLFASDTIGKKISEILPDIRKNEFDWIKFYGDIAIEGGKKEFKQYSESLRRWYRVDVYSPEKYYFITLFVDISSQEEQLSELENFFENKQIEKQLKDQKEQFELAIKGSNDGIWDWDLTTNALYLSPKWKEQLGFDEDELTNEFRSFESRIHPEDKEWVFEKVKQYLDGTLPLYDIEFRMIHKDGNDRWLRARGEALRDSEGNLYRMAGSHTDITQQKEAESALRESEEKLRQISESMGEVFWLRSEDNSRILYVNPAYEQVWGRSCQSLYDDPQSFLESIHDEDKAAAFMEFLQYQQTGRFDMEYRIIRPLGDIRWVHARSFPVRDKKGNIIRHTGIAIDITERRRAEEEKENIAAEYEKVFHSTQDAMFLVKATDSDAFKYMRNNQTHQETTGFSLEEFRGKTPEELVGNEVGNLISMQYKKCLDSRISITYEETLKLPGGVKTWLTTLSPVLQNGKVHYIVGSSRDITDRKRAEEALQERERYLRTILETTQDGFWVVDNQGQITDVNEAYCRMTGYTQKELLGKKIRELEALETPQETAARIQRIIENGSELFETCHKKKDGSLLDVEVSVACIDRDTGVMVCFCRDISERKQMDKKIKQYQDIVNNMQVGLHLYHMEDRQDDSTLRMVAANPAAAIHTGIPEEAVIGKTIDEIFPELRRTNHPQRYAEVVRSGNPIEVEDIYYDDKKNVDVAYTVKAFPLPNDCVGVVFENITARKQMAQIIMNEKERFKTTLLSVGDAVISTDYSGNITVLNKIAEQLTGWTQQEAFGKPLGEVFCIINEFTRERCENPAWKVLETGDTIELANHTILVSRDGTERPIEDSAAPIKDAYGNIHGVVLVFRDFTEKKEKQDRIIYLSFYDQLTGVYNRRYFEEEFKRLDTKKNLPITLAMLDVNGLKLTNDAFGHIVGDKVLKRVAEVMKRECRMGDIIARIGGDEFVILFLNTNTNQAKIVVERIHEMITREKVDSINLSISYGWETKQDSEQAMAVIFKKAEDDMYRRKLSDSSSMRYRTIDIIMKTLFEKNQREENHSKRVSRLCEKVGRSLQFSHEEIGELQMVGLMHDIGKIAIHEDILNKPAALNDSEWMEIKRHPEIGYRILSSVNEYAPLAEYVLAHHERWDGKGYPKGLKGKEIPLQARIIAVVDAYDAMTGYRPYHKALSKDAAVAELRKNAGSQFDPDIVQAFVERVFK